MYYTFLVLRIFIQFNVFVDGTKETEPKREPKVNIIASI